MVVAVVVVTTVQVAFYRHHFTMVSEAHYVRYAYELDTSAAWRWGFISGGHGAYFVKIANSVQLSHPRHDACAIAKEMRREYHRLWVKSVIEGCFYLLVPALSFGLFRLVRRPLRQVLASAISVGVGVGAFVLPSACGYGWSIFTRWVGPCALSYSSFGPFFTGLSADTVSYRPLLELLLIPPLRLLSLLPRSVGLAEAPSWLMILLFIISYGLVGAGLGVVLALVDKSWRPNSR